MEENKVEWKKECGVVVDASVDDRLIGILMWKRVE